MSREANDKSIVGAFLGEIWWMVLVRGIIMLMLGWTALTRPGITMVILVQFLGVYWLVDGIVTALKSIRGRKTMAHWGFGIFGGLLLALVGVVVLVYPLATTVAFAGLIVFVVAFSAIISGLSNIISGIRLRKEIENEGSMILGGIFSLIVGVLLLMARPGLTIAWMVVIIGILAVIGGILLIVEAFKIRKIGKNLA